VFFGAAAEYFRRLVGGDVEPVDITASIGVTASVLAQADPERVQLTIVNLSANSLYIRPNKAPSSTEGIFLAANGGGLSMSVADDGTLCAQEWRAIASGAASAVFATGLRRINLEG
jgi:hypothetical protein